MNKPLRPEPRSQLLAAAGLAADFLAARRESPVTAGSPAPSLDARLQAYDFAAAQPVETVAADMFSLLGSHVVRSDHPRYFGLFNPPALPAAIVGDLIAAAIP